MSVATELQRIIDAKADLKTAIEAKGVTVSSSALIDDYADYVDSIPTGGGAVEEKLLNFIDYDGTIIASYDGSEIAGLTALPDGPDHSQDEVPLTFDEWNWTLAEIQSYHTSYSDAKLWVGASYHPTDGKTHLFYNVIDDNRIPIQIYLNKTGSGETVDWGDGSAVQTFGSSTMTHTYTTKGLFHCVISHTNSTEIRIGGGQSSASNALRNFSKLYHAFISNVITSLGVAYNCSALQSITMPSSVTSINENAFGMCYSLQSITIPRATTSIGAYAFADCRSLRIVSLPNTLTSFGAYGVFSNCFALRSVTIPNGITKIGDSTFYYCYSLQSLVIPNDVTQIGNNTFYYCYSLQSITLPNTMTSIGSSCINSCRSLQSITLPNTMTSIGNYAFSDNYSLYSVIVLATTPPTLGTSAFNTSYQEKIYVPYSADHSILDAYKAATNWSNFASIMEELPE